MGISAAAGAAAAATGAHVNGNATTAQVLGLGAIAGLLKSGIMNAAVLMSLTMNNVFVEVLLIYVMSTFGAAVLVTSYVALKVLDRGMQRPYMYIHVLIYMILTILVEFPMSSSLRRRPLGLL